MRVVSFLSVSLGCVDIVWDAGLAAVHLRLAEGLTVHNNDWAGSSYRKVTSIRIPITTLSLLLASSFKSGSWVEAAYADVDVSLDIYSSPAGWEESARLQKAFIEFQDAQTGRFAALFNHKPGT